MSRTRLVVRDVLGSFLILGLAISCSPDQAWAGRSSEVHHLQLATGRAVDVGGLVGGEEERGLRDLRGAGQAPGDAEQL